jgi:hypothetical protein
VKDFKRVVRERAAKTGESYTAARRALVGTAEAPDDLAFAFLQVLLHTTQLLLPAGGQVLLLRQLSARS